MRMAELHMESETIRSIGDNEPNPKEPNMPNVNDAFPSKYLKAADLKGRTVTVTMDRAVFEKIGDDEKLILYFEDKDKGMVLNKTNATNIAHAYGDDSEDWKGQPIVLFEAMVDFQGKTVPAIRVRMPQAKDRQAPTSTAPARKPEPTGDARMDDDDVPF